MDKSADAFRTISEAAEELDVPQHVLRFWETRFSQIKPMKRGGGRRYYRPEDMELLRAIRHLLYGEGYTIRGVQRLLKERGLKMVIAMRTGGAVPTAVAGAPIAAPVPRESISLDADLDEPHGELAPAIHMELDEMRQPAARISVPAAGQVQPEQPPMPDVEPLLRALLADISEAQRLLRAARMS
jgi:DNA-binding transcriptional MerR regulator